MFYIYATENSVIPPSLLLIRNTAKKKKKENFKNTSYILLEKEPLSEDII